MFPCPVPGCALISVTRTDATQHAMDHTDPAWVELMEGYRVEAVRGWELLKQKRGKK